MADKTAYTIRNIEKTFWKKVRVKAATEGRSIRTIILSLLKGWIK